ncbi:MAG: hypothetical protein GW839_00915 [Flavobacteriales bacterium]|nr:hypothetical protein [Flavobacteriia bacterium]NCP07158.1 hypothetical protein [Flavobacteriales bacterium]PIV93445.1 MAG: hypothetical protein COW44_09260 [Flavobacteriaceae bacterium CG17_big_fil_post_rev_8_21_14_2_50_33_15]PIY09464.1 MAG: hypothetical protein COZ17_12765 [Flavobacteriaceae bacterium CG_4_10_14_3_um_filter_33_47]PJB18422.1 MAG: hypothetical protein CO117_08130 [Flavobacteriaceae bacterium CG_4_9_14_3_um_filter_33_16]
MRKILIVIGMLSMFSFTSNTKIKLANTNTESIEVVKLACNELAQGYYEFMVNQEGVDPRVAGQRARDFRDACEGI